MRKQTMVSLAAAVVLSLSLSACNGKVVQENEQLKAQVAQLQKDNGDLGNRVESLTADRDALAKENEALKNAGKTRAVKRTAKKTAPKRRGRQTRPARGL